MIKILKQSIIIIVYVNKILLTFKYPYKCNNINKSILGLDNAKSANIVHSLNGLLAIF